MSTDTQEPSTDQEKRTQTRVQVNFPISVVTHDKETLIAARNEDISWGGARFVIPEPVLQIGDKVRVQFPWANGKTICAHATVLRTQPLEDGQYLVASRFSSLSPGSEQRLERLLDMLVAKRNGTGTGEAPFADRLEILFSDAEDMQSTLSEIQTGELWVTSFNSYTEDQSIQLALGGTTDLPTLTLRARVFQRKPLQEGNFDWADLHLIGLKFEHSLRELEAVIGYVLDKLGSPRLENLTGTKLDLALSP